MKLPKINNETKIAFIQYFFEKFKIYNNKEELAYKDSGKNYIVYLLEENMEPYYETLSSIYSFNSFYYISYFNYKDYIDDLKNIINDCKFSIENIRDTFNNITFDISTNCISSVFNYTIFIDNYTEDCDNYYSVQKLYDKKKIILLKILKYMNSNKKELALLKLLTHLRKEIN